MSVISFFVSVFLVLICYFGLGVNILIPTVAVGVTIENKIIYEPYARNLTPDQARQISDKYKSVFGNMPSPLTLQHYGYRLKSKTLEDVLAGIVKKQYQTAPYINFETLLDGGIDMIIAYKLSIRLSKAVNWLTILNSENPNLELRKALNLFINQEQVSDAEIVIRYNQAQRNSNYKALAGSGNIIIKRKDGSCRPSCYQGIDIVDSHGYVYTMQFEEAVYVFGLSLFPRLKESLYSIANQLESQNILYKPGELYARSDAGFNFRDYADGGSGYGYKISLANAIGHQESSIKFFGNRISDSVLYGPIEDYYKKVFIAQETGIDLTKRSRVLWRRR